MNKKIKTSLVAIAIIAIASTCVGCSDSKNETASTTVPTTTATQATTQPQTTQKPTQAETQAQTEKATEAPEQNNAEQATQAPAPQNENYDSPDPTIPNVMGVWKNQDNPDLGSIEIVNQAGNTIDIIITSKRNSEATQIATAKASLTLDEISPGSITVSGSGSFEYTDSFGNTGTGRIGVNESVIRLDLTETSNSGRGWGISHASGNYLPPYSE